MEWITLILPIAREVRSLIEVFSRDNGRMPTEAELENALSARRQADADWGAVLKHLREDAESGN